MTQVFQFFRLTYVLYFFIFLLVSVTGITIVVTETENRRVAEFHRNWLEHDGTIARKVAFLGLLKDSLGYGGFIHNTKNYVLRGDETYLIKAHKSLLDIRVILNGYRHFGITPVERTQLARLEKVLQKYSAAIILAESLRYQGGTPVEIDRRIKIDDRPAISALHQLDIQLVEKRQKNILKMSRQILSIHEVITTTLTGIGVLLGIATLLMVWFLHRRLIAPIRNLTNSFTAIDPTMESGLRLPVRVEKWRDELDQVAIAGNAFLDASAAHLNNHKKAEADLAVALHKAEAANEAKSVFLSSMSHELRTPMNAILGFAQILEISDSSQLSPEQRRCVEQILESGNILIGLIDAILTYAGMGDDELKENVGYWDLGVLLAEEISIAQDQGKVKRVTLRGDECLKDLPKVYVSPKAVTRAFHEILTNAVLFNRPGGNVSIDGKVLEDGFIRISVRDEGRGIPLESQNELFVPFRRLGLENMTIPGTGLGLTLALRLMEKTGGRIGFESRLGVGSTFWIELPQGKLSQEVF